MESTNSIVAHCDADPMDGGVHLITHKFWNSQEMGVSAFIFLGIYFKLFADAGIRIAVGTDGGGAVVHSFQGYNTPREMEILAACCLTNMQTIVASTKTGADIMQAGALFGTLQAGRSADLLILNADPLADIRAVRDFDRLVVRGQLINRSALTYEAYLNDKTRHQAAP